MHWLERRGPRHKHIIHNTSRRIYGQPLCWPVPTIMSCWRGVLVRDLKMKPSILKLVSCKNCIEIYKENYNA